MQIRASFKKWLYQARWASEVERVKEECTKLIPDIHGFLNGAINPRLQLLEEGAAAEARRTDLLADKNKEIWAHLQSTIVGQLLHVKTARLSCLAVDRATALEHKAKKDTEALEKMATELDMHSNFRRNAEERVQNAEGTVTQLSEQLALVARDDDVKNMMKDILLIWTAVKQLDSAKADRKEVENLGLEDTALEQRISDLYSDIKESKNKHEELEFMFGLVVRLLEDIANIQFAKIQTRPVASGKAGNGRIETRPTLRASLCRAQDISSSASKISIAALPLAEAGDKTERGGDTQCATEPRFRPAYQPASECKTQAQSQAAPDCRTKQAIRTPTVAAFAEWVSNIQKTLKQECSAYDNGAHLLGGR
ncbi:hypothetical protein ETH_00030800 [Eimeria tenella]|uniref:Uncharacterized protein n=1 Tax=Eimeria tenella TaxID=5802 RepID=U6KHQ9_EIMTE|nr:hypothetical protein ETH_00030800 [Eimeria tenella]CDJ37464.1 hypothetical protein ETH_00030800 [Eimeria tenella]|eukprot:XP_013228302.1 hypothetical protein ETH_00030800 [Eimeria tenella]